VLIQEDDGFRSGRRQWKKREFPRWSLEIELKPFGDGLHGSDSGGGLEHDP
jgi:hypothetical protein